MKSQHVSTGRIVAKKLIAAGVSALMLAGLIAATTLLSSHEAAAKPEFATQTKLPCGQCHANPGGSGKLKSFGEKFKANGFKLK